MSKRAERRRKQRKFLKERGGQIGAQANRRGRRTVADILRHGGIIFFTRKTPHPEVIKAWAYTCARKFDHNKEMMLCFTDESAMEDMHKLMNEFEADHPTWHTTLASFDLREGPKKVDGLIRTIGEGTNVVPALKDQLDGFDYCAIAIYPDPDFGDVEHMKLRAHGWNEKDLDWEEDEQENS